MNYNFIKSSIMGLVVGDALGVPVEFQSRISLSENPVTDMRGDGTYNQPAGTWSDDSSMVLATMESLIHGLSYSNIMDKFMAWLLYGGYTPYGKVFDVGESTRRSIMNYGKRTPPLECGGRRVEDNGNGSLMRILPVVLYLLGNKADFSEMDVRAFQVVHEASCLTHAHARSQVACGIYAKLISEIYYYGRIKSKIELLSDAITSLRDTYEKEEFANIRSEFHTYHRLHDAEEFASLPVTAVKSSGYVVDTLEASIWCFLNTESYKECVLKAVNLGEDTDTSGAVAGGLAGALYGYKNIPEEWIKVIAKKEWIEEICNQLECTMIS